MKEPELNIGAHNGGFLRAIFIACTALFVILSFHPDLIPSREFLFIFFFIYLVLVPGALIAPRIAPETRGAVFLLASFVFGITAIFFVLLGLALFRLDITLVRIIMPVIVVALALAPRPAKPLDDTAVNPLSNRGLLSRSTPAVLLCVLMMLVWSLVLRTDDPFRYTADSTDHIAYIRTVARTHEAFPDRFYYAEGGMLTHDIRKGMAHALWGSLLALTGGHDAAATWPCIALVGSTFFVVAVYAAGALLFGSAWIGLVAAVLTVLLYDGGLARLSLLSMGAGYIFGKAPYVAALAFGLSWLETGRRSALAVAAAAAVAAACAHIAHLAVFLFAIAVFACSTLLRGRDPGGRAAALRRLAALGAAAVALAAPYLLMRYVRDYAPNNALHTHVQGVLSFAGTLYIMNPLVFAQAAGPLGLLSLVSIVLLRRRMRDHGAFRLLAHGIVAVYLLLFVPLWFPFLLRRLSYLLIRFEFVVPSMLLSAFLLGELSRRLFRSAETSRAARSRAAALMGLALAAAIIGPALARMPSRFAYATRAAAAHEPAGFRSLSDLFSFIDASVPPGSVIAADPVTSFGIPAFTDGYAMVPFDQHATPNDSTAIRRIVDARRIVSPYTAPGDVAAILDAYGARHLILNGRLPRDVGTLYWKPSASAMEETATALGRCGAFSERFSRNSVSLFSYDPARRGECAPASKHPPFVGEEIDAGDISAMRDSREPRVRIERVALSRPRAARGDTIRVAVTWVASAPCPFSSYIAYLRFDTGFPRGPAYRAAWGKPYRKLRELLAGERYRFRIDFQPFDGIFPPDEWPPLRKMHDRVAFSIPRDAAPGTYTIRLRMAERTQYPNYVLGDIFTDDDFYQGVEVGRVEIE